MKNLKILYYIFAFVTLIFSSYAFFKLLLSQNLSALEYVLCIITLLVSLMLSVLLQTIIHELGHLIFGLITKYKFVAFQLFSISLVNKDNKIRIEKSMIPGTLGYNIMEPLLGDYKKQPFFLYILGGVILNIIFSLLILCIVLLNIFNLYVNIALHSCIFVGWFFMLNNGIPKKVNSLANDGYNALFQRKSDIIRKSTYVQLKIQSLSIKGILPSQMPEEWFELSDLIKETLSEPLLINNLINKCGLLMEKHDFNSAYDIYKYINDNIDSSNLFYINECKCELMFLNIIKDLNINDIYTDDLKKYINLSSMSMSKKRLMYAYYLIYIKDADTANKIYNDVSRLCKNYIPESEAKIEMELINFIKKNYENKRIGVL